MQKAREMFELARELWREMSTDDIGTHAASLSYRFLLAVFPFFIFLSAMGAFVSRLLDIENPSGELMERMGSALPADARSTLKTQLGEVLEKQRPGLLSFGILGAIWAAASGMQSTMKAMNVAYDVEEQRPFWRRIVVALGLTIGGGALFLLAFVLAVAGQAVVSGLAGSIGLGAAYDAVAVLLRFAAMVVFILTAVSIVLWAAPNAHLPFKWITRGGVLFVVLWSVMSLGFGWYVSNFGSYSATYGALGGLVVMMIWFYLTAYVLLTAGELNALLARRNASAAMPPRDDGGPAPTTSAGGSRNARRGAADGRA